MAQFIAYYIKTYSIRKIFQIVYNMPGPVSINFFDQKNVQKPSGVVD